jgi:hypothetical protein
MNHSRFLTEENYSITLLRNVDFKILTFPQCAIADVSLLRDPVRKECGATNLFQNALT